MKEPEQQRGYVEQRLQNTHEEVVVLAHAAQRQLAGAAERALDAADAESVDEVGREAEGNTLVRGGNRAYFWNGENGALLEEAVEVDVGDGAVALDEDVVVVAVAEPDHVG